MYDYEKLGVFYMGRSFDIEAGKTGPDPVLYDSKDLTTHAVIVGMTGSGKTVGHPGGVLTATVFAGCTGAPAGLGAGGVCPPEPGNGFGTGGACVVGGGVACSMNDSPNAATTPRLAIAITSVL